MTSRDTGWRISEDEPNLIAATENSYPFETTRDQTDTRWSVPAFRVTASGLSAAAYGPMTCRAVREYRRDMEGSMSSSAIDRLVADCRRTLHRVEPVDLADEFEAGALVVDTRPLQQRQRDGGLPGALVIDRNVLEWRLDPSSAYRIPEVTHNEIRIIVVCNEGYSSSLAAATLQRLGLRQATDLRGGYQAWAQLHDHHHDRAATYRGGIDQALPQSNRRG